MLDLPAIPGGYIARAPVVRSVSRRSVLGFHTALRQSATGGGRGRWKRAIHRTRSASPSRRALALGLLVVWQEVAATDPVAEDATAETETLPAGSEWIDRVPRVEMAAHIIGSST